MKPIQLQCKKGTYYKCECGKSGNQPLCDGSHAGSGLFPSVHHLDKSRLVSWCTCKKSGSYPFCDGTHSLNNENL